MYVIPNLSPRGIRIYRVAIAVLIVLFALSVADILRNYVASHNCQVAGSRIVACK